MPESDRAPAPEVIVRDEAAVRWISLNRPETRNALTEEVNRRVIEALPGGGGDAIRCVAITGEGGAFCSGLDLRSAMGSGTPDLGEVERRMRENFHGLIEAIRACPHPVVALVDGPAAGFGASLAAACDLRVATDRAWFQLTFVRIGLCPDGGSTWTLPRLVGHAKALEMLLLGDRVDAAEALRWGLVGRVVPAAEGRQACADLCARLAAGPPRVLAHVKRLVHEGLSRDLHGGLEGEVAAQMECLRSQDFFEGLAAFFQKRAPVFTGK